MGRGSRKRGEDGLKKELKMAYRKINQLEKERQKLNNFNNIQEESSIIATESGPTTEKLGDCPQCKCKKSIKIVDIDIRILHTCNECNYRRSIKKCPKKSK